MESFESAEAYFENGRKTGFPAAGGKTAYTLRAQFSAKAVSGGVEQGKYQDTWLDDSHWRREAWFANSHYLRSRGGDTTYQFEEGPDVGAMRFVLKALEPIPAIDTFHESDWGIRRDTVNGVPTIRVLAGHESPEEELDRGTARGYWFDETGTLVKTYFDGIETVRSDFSDFAGAKVAHQITALVKGEVAMTISVTEIEPASAIAPNTFKHKGHEWKRAFTAEVR